MNLARFLQTPAREWWGTGRFEFPLWLGAAVLVGAGQAAKSSVSLAQDFRAKNVPIFQALGFGTKSSIFAQLFAVPRQNGNERA
jgi:hypothetical protein